MKVRKGSAIATASCVVLTIGSSLRNVDPVEAFSSQKHSHATSCLQRVQGKQSFRNQRRLRAATQDEDTARVSTEPLEALRKSSFVNGLVEKMGTVDDERIAFPEYDSGDVPRMFSSLEYTASEQGRIVKANHNAGSVWGATALVAGTMVGAGVLALPTATAPVGFLPSTVAMGVAWFYMTMSGLLIAELCLNRLVQSGKPGRGLLDLYQDRLGKWGIVGSAAYFFLHYAVVVAYIAQGGVNLDGLLNAVGLADMASIPGIGQVAFAAICGLGLFAASPALVEKFNNALVVVMAACFAGIIGLGAQTADFHSLIDLSNQHPEQVAGAFPIIFLALVYQNVIPTIVTQLEGDRSKIKLAVIAGTTIPTLLFLAWNAVILGNVAGMDSTGMDPVAILQAAQGSTSLLGPLVGGFSSIALVTSLIGFTYGLLDAWTDTFQIPRSGPTFEQYKIALFALVFLPPLALSVSDPDIFYNALDIGGAFGVSTLFLVLPPIMIWGQRYGEAEKDQPLVTKPMVPFGKLALGSMWKAAGTLIVEQGAEKLGVFEWIQDHLHLGGV